MTPHLLRIVELANEAQKGVNVHWHLNDAVAHSMAQLTDVASQAPTARQDYVRVLHTAPDTARRIRRD
ncbi:MAG: hypothetical protein ACJ8GV_05325 [Luteimonas sp.]